MACTPKAWRFASALGLIFSISTVVAGCGGGDDLSPTASAAAELAGTWNKIGLDVEGRSVSCPNTLTVNNVIVDACAAGEGITFTATNATSGNYRLTYPASRFGNLTQETGRYEYSGGDTLTLSRTGVSYDANRDGQLDVATEVSTISPTQRITYDIDIVGNIMTLQAIQGPLTKSDGTRFTNSDNSINVAILTVDGTLPQDAPTTDPSSPLPNSTITSAILTLEKQP